tara:strand:- start:258 stop:638 length:381 start_codon:yes stop_codon:yes gene_type:complete
MKRFDISELSFDKVFENFPTIPKNSWVWYESKNKAFATELKQKKRPWLISETFYDEPSPSALAYGRTRNPKGGKKHYFRHDKYPDFSDDGWIVGNRESIDLDDCEYFQLEKDDEIQNKLRNFYKGK